MSRRRPLTTGEMLKAGFHLTGQHWRQLVLLSAITYLPISVLAYFVAAEMVPLNPGSEAGQQQLVVVLLILAGMLMLGTYFAMATLHHAIADAYLGQQVDWRHSLRRTVPRLPVILAAGLVTLGVSTVVAAVGWALAVFAGLIGVLIVVVIAVAGVVIGLTFGTMMLPVAVREVDLGVREILQRTWRLVRQRWLPLLGLIILTGVIVSILQNSVGKVLEAALVDSALSVEQAIGWLIVVQAVPSVLFTPISVAVFTIAYFDLRVRNGENIDPGGGPSIGAPTTAPRIPPPPQGFVLPVVNPPAFDAAATDPDAEPLLRPRWSEPLSPQ